MANIRIAETGDVRFQQLEVAAGEVPKLRVAGLLFHSAAVAENIRLIEDGRTTRVLVEMAPAHASKSGRFETSIPLPSEVERVTFGQAGEELWSREGDRTRPIHAGVSI